MITILEVFGKFRVTRNSDLQNAKRNAFWVNLDLKLSLYSVSSGLLRSVIVRSINYGSVKHIAHLCRSLSIDRLEMNFIPLKLSKVIPVYKVIDESDPSSYRSISPTSIFNRVYKKNGVLSPKIVPWKYNILDDSQCRFREKRSTKLGIFDIISATLE